MVVVVVVVVVEFHGTKNAFLLTDDAASIKNVPLFWMPASLSSPCLYLLASLKRKDPSLKAAKNFGARTECVVQKKKKKES